MIVKTVLAEERLTVSEVKEIFVELTTPRSEEEFTYEFRRAFDHVKTYWIASQAARQRAKEPRKDERRDRDQDR
jgi:DNA-directed RNA polymerase subunit F